MKDLGHGANVDEMARLYGKNPKEIIDFSSNINPKLYKLERKYIKIYRYKSRLYNTWEWCNRSDLFAYEEY